MHVPYDGKDEISLGVQTADAIAAAVGLWKLKKWAPASAKSVTVTNRTSRGPGEHTIRGRYYSTLTEGQIKLHDIPDDYPDNPHAQENET